VWFYQQGKSTKPAKWVTHIYGNRNNKFKNSRKRIRNRIFHAGSSKYVESASITFFHANQKPEPCRFHSNRRNSATSICNIKSAKEVSAGKEAQRNAKAKVIGHSVRSSGTK
jgi:hypothetical protein